jgi:hypothetical protein
MRGSFRVHSVIDLCALVAMALVGSSRDRERAAPKHPAARPPQKRPLIIGPGQGRSIRDWALN